MLAAFLGDSAFIRSIAVSLVPGWCNSFIWGALLLRVASRLY